MSLLPLTNLPPTVTTSEGACALPRYDELPCKIELPPAQAPADWERAQKGWIPVSEALNEKSDFWTGAGYWRGFFVAFFCAIAGYWFALRSRTAEVVRGARHGLIVLVLLDVLATLPGLANRLQLRGPEALVLFVVFAVFDLLGLSIATAIWLALWSAIFRVARRFMYAIAVGLLTLSMVTFYVAPPIAPLVFGFSLTPVFLACCHQSNELSLCRHFLPRAGFVFDKVIPSWFFFILGLVVPPVIALILMNVAT